MEKSRKVPRLISRFPTEVEEAILEYSLHYPTHGQERTANELNRKESWNINGGRVRGS
jgi:hypothetical protein